MSFFRQCILTKHRRVVVHVVLGTCARSGCLRRRAVNQLTGQLHDHCSIDCMRQDHAAEPVSDTAEESGTAVVVHWSHMHVMTLVYVCVSLLYFVGTFCDRLYNSVLVVVVQQCWLKHQILQNCWQTIRLIYYVHLRCLVYSFCVKLDLFGLVPVRGQWDGSFLLFFNTAVCAVHVFIFSLLHFIG